MMIRPLFLSNEPVVRIWLEIEKLAYIEQGVKLKATVAKLILQLDALISEQLSLIVQEPCFKKLEGSWLGLQDLANSSLYYRRVKIKMLDFSWRQVSEDLNYSFDIKRSFLYHKIYNEELDMAGGNPFGLLLIDHKINSDYVDGLDDLYTLQLLSELGESTLCPVLLGVDEFFFGDDPNRLLHDNSRLERIIESNDFNSWELLRNKPSSRFLHLVLPEYEVRKPYQDYITKFIFNETNSNDNRLWANSAYLLACNVIREFNRINWFGFLRAYDEQGSYGAIVENQKKSPINTKVDIFAESDGFWSKLGFIPLSGLYLSEQKGFFSNQSVWKMPANMASVIGMLQTNLMACRFAHYIKIQFRDQIGRFDTVTQCRTRLETWLKKYTGAIGSGDNNAFASNPLKDFKVIMEQDPDDPTRFLCEIMLQPQYQYEIIDAKVVLQLSINNQEKTENT